MQPYNNYPQNGQPYQQYTPNIQGTQQYQQYPPYPQQNQQWPDPNLLIQALMPSYTGKAVAVLLLYFCGYLPGLICNIIFPVEASNTRKQFGRSPQGMSLLTILLILALTIVPAIVLSVGFTFMQMLLQT